MKTFLYWLLAIIITLTAAVYQRMTGPTYEKKIAFIHNGVEQNIELIRSYSTNSPAPVILEINDGDISGNIYYKKYPSNDDFIKVELVHVNNTLEGVLPNQPPAGKLEYYIELLDANSMENILTSEHVIIRYKGDVPSYVLIPHIFLMFFAMLFSNLTGLLALGKRERYRFYTMFTTILLFIGGMILGPVVQKFAFGELWTGVPFGWDLTDNKTLIAFIFWLIAVVGNWKKERPYLSLIAAIVLLLVYSIPHSMFGSELDYTTGTIGQG